MFSDALAAARLQQDYRDVPHHSLLGEVKALSTVISMSVDRQLIDAKGAADSVVVCGRRILPKTETEAEARDCLLKMSGRRHRVLGGVAVAGPDGKVRTRLIETIVRFTRLEIADIDAYLASGEWQGKAGGYAIQGRAAAFVAFLSGSYSNVVGLPLFETVSLLKSAAR